jgi:MH1 domain
LHSSIYDDENDDNDQHSSLIAISDNRCYYYRCICRPMFFSKKSSLRKRLWRSRVTSTSTSPRQNATQPRQEPYFHHEYQFLSNEASTESYYYQQQQHQPPQQHHHHQENLNCSQSCGVAREGGSSLLSTTTAVLRNCCSNSNSSSTSDLYINSTEQQTQKSFRLLMNQLKKENQLETLCQAIEYGIQQANKILPPHQYQPTDCVLVPRGSIDSEEPQVIACRLWRWSDLYDCNAIKRIPSCPNEKDPIYVCCNPAHWSRVYQIGN